MFPAFIGSMHKELPLSSEAWLQKMPLLLWNRIAFGLSLGATLLTIGFLPTDSLVRGFLAMSVCFTVGFCFGVSPSKPASIGGN